MEHRLSILHISDLHAQSEDVSELPSDLEEDRARQQDRREQVLNEQRSRVLVTEDAWDDNLRELFPEDAPDLVCFTGDVADWGLSAEYREAQRFVERTLEVLGVDASRFFVVPGNHDVQRTINREQWERLRDLMWSDTKAVSRWIAPRGKPPRDVPADLVDQVLERTRKFWRWVEHDLGRPELLPSRSDHRRLGYHCELDLPKLPFPIHVVGLDSAWLAGDRNDQGKLWLTRYQRDRLLFERGQERGGFRLALVHHPLTELAQPEIAPSQRDLFQAVDLLLHGHQHEPAGHTLVDLDGQPLRVLAAGCLFEGAEGRAWKNSCHRIDITLDDNGRPLRAEIRFRGWSERAGWHPDASLYRLQTDDGRMLWRPWEAEAPGRATEMDIEPNRPLVTAARFVGRKVELGELGRLLKQSNSVTAVHGMPGVGKTFLTEHFAQQNRDRFPQHVRIGLRPDESRTVDELLGTLAAQLHTESRDLVAELAATRTLVIIDNVDSAPLVGRVMDLWSHLARIPLLVIGRYDELGREAGWLRVELRPYEGYREPLEQLNKEGVDTTGSSMQEDLCAMIDALGHLPLALSLAAGHLRNHAYTPRGFVDELRRRGLSVVPADPSDLRRFGDDSARAVLRTSFELSWEHLRRELHAQEHDTDEVGTMLRGLCHMAHGLACPLGPNLAAAACGLSEDLARKVLATATTLSLVQRTVGRVAWSLHPLIAEFLRASTIEIDLDAVKRSTSEWFLERLRRAGQRNDEQAKVRKELTDEGEALFLWLSDQMGRDAYTAVEVGFDFAKDCGPYIAWAEACKRAETAMLDLKEQSTRLWCLATFAMSAGELDTAMRAAEHMVDVETRLSNERGIAHAKEKIADILQARGDLDRALQILENDVLPVHESTGNAREKAVTMGRVADIVRIRGDPNRALQILENDVLLVYERIGDIHEKALTMGKIADILRARGDLDRALQILEGDVVPAYDYLGNIRFKAVAMGEIANILQARGDFDRAVQILEGNVLPAFERVGDVHGKTVTMGKIADILQARGDLDGALQIIENDVLPAFEGLGDVRFKAVAMGKAATILQSRGDYDRALQMLENEVLPTFEYLDDVHGRAHTMGQIADVLRMRGDFDQALKILQCDELPIYEHLGDVRSKAITMGKIADILQAQGKLGLALNIRQNDELPVYGRLGDVHSQAATMGKIADILCAQGELERALQMLEGDVLAAFERLGELHGKGIAMGKIAHVLEARGDLDRALQIRQHDELPIFERLGDEREKAVAKTNIARLLFLRNGPSALVEATRLLAEAHHAFTRMGLPEAATIESIANHLGLDLSLVPSD